MKKSNLWRALVAVGISALAVPTFVQAQTSGGSTMGGGMSSGTGSSGSSSMREGGMSGSSRSSQAPGGSSSSTSPSSDVSSGRSTTGMSSGSMMESSSAMADRGTTAADQTLNQNIRQALNADSSLGSAAKNVHFSTDNGKVTLEGAVATEKEKKDIEAKVEKMAGVKDVDNQLQIAPTASGSASGMSGSESTTSSGKSMGGSSHPSSASR